MFKFFIRGIPDEVGELITTDNPAAEIRGKSSPRAGWLRASVCIAALGSLDPEIAIPSFSLWQSALQIAKVRRDEDDLQPVEMVKGKFIEQYAKFDKARESSGGRSLEAINKLSNVLYYAVQSYAQDNDLRDFQASCKHACGLVQSPVSVALRVAAAKYRERATRPTKDKEREYAAMQAVLDECSNSSKTA
jgi:hypothetical protein